MRSMYADSELKDSVEHNWSGLAYDGKPDSWAPEMRDPKYHNDLIDVLEGLAKFTFDGKELT